MLYAILSILILTLLVWVINKKLSIQICPICAGVTLTWIWLFIGIWFGFLPIAQYEFVTAILMGATIGGIVGELKKMFLKLKNQKKSEEESSSNELQNKMENCC